MKKIRYLSLIVCLNLLFLSFSYAGDLDEHWIGSVPDVMQVLGDDTLKNISIYTKQDHVVYYVEGISSSASVHCHYHHDNNSSHCNYIVNGKDIPLNFEILISVSADKIGELLEQLSISPLIANDAIWPWIVGAVVAYYFAKKIINYWVYKTFTPKPHSHADFFIPKKDLEVRIDEETRSTSERFNRIESLLELSSRGSGSKLSPSDLNLLLNRQILSLTQALIKDMAHSHCTSCGHDHGLHYHGHKDHGHYSFGLRLNNAKTNVSTASLFSAQETSSFKAEQILPRKDNVFRAEMVESKEAVSSGIIIKVTKAIIMDLKKELIDPVVTLGKGAYKTVSDRHNLRQLNAYIQTNYRVTLGESNYVAASAIALSLATVKVTGEAIESAFVGPYHVFCQISDAAVVGLGLGLFSAYHCLRQPARKKSLALLLKSKFWSIMFNRIKNPIELTENIKGLDKKIDADKLFLNEISSLKSNIKKLIWQFRLDGRLKPKQANSLAKELGQTNKRLEDLLFDIKLEESMLSQDLRAFINRFQSIIAEYKYIYTTTFDYIEQNEYSISNEITLGRSCISFLK